MSGFKIPRPAWVRDELVAERGEYAGFQMYTREGNDLVALAVMGLAIALEEQPTLTRHEAIGRLQLAIKQITTTHPEVHDTEPECEIVDVMNLLFATRDWRGITRDDLEDWS